MVGRKDIEMTEYIKSMRKHIGHERLLIAGAGVFIHKDGKLLMQKRKDNGCWAADHGGCMELGETVEETAKRELLEETGLTANSLELLGIFSGKELFYTYPNGDMVSNVNIAYLCEDFSGELVTQTDETTELQWFGLDELPDNISPPTIPALKRCVEELKKREKKIMSNEKNDMVYKKLVRDNIPAIIEAKGQTPVVRVLDDNEYLDALNNKLQEEVAEYLDDNCLEELCDILEIVYAIARVKGHSENDIEVERHNKNMKNGAFANRLFLEKVEKLV
jgi:predicted house-cleaning noncanonical NTP pyrophosphatase (MazG superfamily)/8-oxo-dGTP pyrophosphatase MutT (NUDIX family)